MLNLPPCLMASDLSARWSADRARHRLSRVRPVLSSVNRTRASYFSGVRRRITSQQAAKTATVPQLVDAMSQHSHWNTLDVQRVILVAAHTVTSLMRLEDIVMLLEDDPRVQLIFTQVPDRLGADVDQRLRQQEARIITWEEATQRPFDLVVSASLHRLEDISATAKFAAPHGAGFNKLWPTWAWPSVDEKRPVYGLDRASLLDQDGRAILDALLLPHPDHLATLARQCPETEQSAVVAGDPCYDRLVACLAQRHHYRSQLGVRDAQVLVAVASTWGQHALLARQLGLLLRLPSELPANHRVIATMHPAVWSEHGVRQVRAWLREVRAAGVDLVDAGEDWRGLIAAADVLVADHSSLTVYAASVGVPVLMSHYPENDVDPSSIVAELARNSHLLTPHAPLFGQLVAARNAQPTQRNIAYGRVAARRGMSAEIIRETLYRLLRLPEPGFPARWPLVPAPRLVQDPPSPRVFAV